MSRSPVRRSGVTNERSRSSKDAESVGNGRGAATRARILDAAIASLIEKGYAATTTLAVQRRAGVSRGALLHHFPSKEELFVAGIRHLAETRLVELRDRARDLNGQEEHLGDAIELLWSLFDSPTFHASVELWTAARTNEDLRSRLSKHEGIVARELGRFCGELFGQKIAAHPQYRTVRNMLLNSMGGAALGRPYVEDLTIRRKIDEWKSVASQILAVSNQ